MLGNTALYAAKKRKKPVQKIPKPPPPDGAKSNPSKRHRDRLNGELDKLTSLLPFTEEVRSRLDKLSVLRLSVGYLKVKSFFNATIKKGQNGSSWSTERSLMFRGNVQNPPSSTTTTSSPLSSQVTSIDGVSFSEGDLLLQALNGFVLVVTAEGCVFYASPTIQDYLGFHQSDVVHQSVFELIHTDDRALFRQQLHFALNPSQSQQDDAMDSDQSPTEVSNTIVTYDPQTIPPENSSFLERNFCCRFRCLLDNSSGFLALNFHGRLKLLHGQTRVLDDGTLVPAQLALFSIATPLQPPSILEIRSKTLLFQTKHKLDFTPMGIDSRGKVVLGYNETELCMKGSGYHFIHAADMMYCADNHLKMIKTSETGLTVFRLLTKSGVWQWVQANARMVFKAGKPDFIVARQRALTNEEGEEHLRLRRLQLPFSFATGEAILYDVTPMVDMLDSCSAPKQRKVDENTISPNSILGCMLRQDPLNYCDHKNADSLSSLNDAAFKDTHALVSVPGDIWKPPTLKSDLGGLVKAESTVQDMIDSLQQILGEDNLRSSLDVELEELKSWESTLLRMRATNCEMSNDLDEIFNNDVLSFVEEQLQKEGGLNLPDQLDDVTACLPTLDLQNEDPLQSEVQNFPWTMEPLNHVIANGGLIGTGQQKLTHIGPLEMSSASLNGPTHQPHLTKPPSAGLHAELATTGSFGVPVTLDPSVLCTQTQNEMRTLQVTGSHKNRDLCSVKQTPANQFHCNQMQHPIQNHPPLVSMGLHDQSPERQMNSTFVFQPGSSVPSANHPNTFMNTYSQNISTDLDFAADPSSSSCFQGHFALQNPNDETLRQSWPQKQQLISRGHQQMDTCLNQMPGLQGNPLTRVNPAQDSMNTMPMFRTAETLNIPAMEVPPLEPSRSCMFSNATPTVPVNGLQHDQTPSCHRLNPAGSHLTAKPSCLYQGLPGGESVGMVAIPHGSPDDSPLSCHLTPSLDPDSLLVQQPYLNFSEQNQIGSRPVIGKGGFDLSLLSNGNAFYLDNK
ncbi:aryl hydrocarbon receptor 2 isoform X2 [Thalassophryne amazonica]|uniref:aryl hydrocarbon receptor 2 isoform X2 n=1 Tax=Thalassophryne amazonica TaxID=390379 RepID=UPI001471A6D2|nr:aryl hydrocarbon receptor 2 isoform X2 [Thalassophryne amazonica]